MDGGAWKAAVHGVAKGWGGGEQEHRRTGEGELGEVGTGREDEVWAEDQRAQLGTLSRAGGAHRGIF